MAHLSSREAVVIVRGAIVGSLVAYLPQAL
jgi:hypothetical protein